MEAMLIENKENLDPHYGPHDVDVSHEDEHEVGRSKPSSRSPLPSWYPRQPLRDITSILNASQGIHNECQKKQEKPKAISTANGQYYASSLGMCMRSEPLTRKAVYAAASVPLSFSRTININISINNMNKVEHTLATTVRRHFR